MKTSSRLILILVGFFGLVIVISAVFVGAYVRRTVDGSFAVEDGSALNRGRLEKEYDFSGFSSVRLTGVWVAEISRGDSYSVRVSAPAYAFDHLDVGLADNTIAMDMEKYTVTRLSGDEVRIWITCPALESLEAGGAATVTVEGFTGPSLKVDVGGAMSVTGTGNRYDRLSLRSEGAADVNFKESLAVDAHVRMNGAGSVKIGMDGGVLDGEVNGIGSLEYYGEVSDMRVRKNGLATVEHR